MPVIQLVLAAGGVVFLLVKIFPNFSTMFKKMKVDLPKITEVMIIMSDALIYNYVAVAAGFAVFCAGIFFALRASGRNAASGMNA